MSVGGRPLGVTILGALGIVFSGLALLCGLALAVLGLSFGPGFGDIGSTFGIVGGVFGVIGVVIAFAGAVGLILSWGLLARKHWAWIVWIAFEVIGLVSSVVSALSAPLAALPGIAVSVIIIWYLLRPHVKAWFEGKPAPSAVYPPPPPPGYA